MGFYGAQKGIDICFWLLMRIKRDESWRLERGMAEEPCR